VYLPFPSVHRPPSAIAQTTAQSDSDRLDLKRAAFDASPGPEIVSRSTSSRALVKPAEDEMGEFEDAWEDEIDDDEEEDDPSNVCDAPPELQRPRRMIVLQAWR